MIMIKEAYWSVFDDNPGRASFFQAYYAALVEAFRPALCRAMDTGEIRTLPIDTTAHVILANLKNLQMQICLKDAPAPEEGAEFLTTVLCDGLLN